MEDLIVEEDTFIIEEKYQEAKKILNKKEDYFTLEELYKLLKLM